MRGLTQTEVLSRIEGGQVNTKLKKTTKTYREIITDNVLTYFNMVNFILFLLILSVESYQNALFFLVVICNSVVGIIQEIRAKKVLDRLEIMIENKVDVLRDNKKKTISIYDLVMDDVFVCKEGMQVPVDAILLEGQIEVNEALLTGEMNPQRKQLESEVYSGTFVVSGEALCRVIHVGKENRSEKIIAVGKEVKKSESALKKSLEGMIRSIGLFLIPIGLLLFYNQKVLLKATYQSSIIQTTSAVIGMIPSGLVFLTSIALVVSILRLGKKNVLAQELHSIETLSRANVICLDKTGTLTEGKHQLQSIKTSVENLKEIMGNYCRVFPSGNATSKALTDYFQTQQTYREEEILPFSSSRKYSAISFKEEGTFYLGAVQSLFPKGDKVSEEKTRKELQEGYRLLVLAHSQERLNEENLPSDLKAIAWLFIKDKVRENAPEIIQYFKRQNIQCYVFSGDDPMTVSQVAKEAQIENASQWIDASKHDIEELKNALKTHSVFGRLIPEQKMALIETLQKQKKIVAMVGDGINDIPALKKADLSVALGNGSDATKNIANLVLLDCDFNAFPQVVDEGRRVINNLTNAAAMFLVKTIFSILLVLTTLLISVEYPFLPIQLTFIGAFSVGVPTFLLQFESSKKQVEGQFLQTALKKALPQAVCIVLGALFIFAFQRYSGISKEIVSTAIVYQTAAIYSLSLYFVYAPLTKLRLSIIMVMQIMMILSFSVLSSFLAFVPLSQEVIWIICGVIFISFLVMMMTYQKINLKKIK